VRIRTLDLRHIRCSGVADGLLEDCMLSVLETLADETLGAFDIADAAHETFHRERCSPTVGVRSAVARTVGLLPRSQAVGTAAGSADRNETEGGPLAGLTRLTEWCGRVSPAGARRCPRPPLRSTFGVEYTEIRVAHEGLVACAVSIAGALLGAGLATVAIGAVATASPRTEAHDDNP
jgi:hypothetical protein